MQFRHRSEKTPLNPALLKDLQQRLGVANLLDWINEEAEKLANKGLVSNSYIDFTKPLLEERNIQILRKDPKTKDAYIRPIPNDKYEIIYQEKLPLYRRRFSIAHEIGHTYLFAPGGGGRPLSPLQNRLGADPTIENLCDQFAASLLLPSTLFQSTFQILENNSTQNSVPLHIIPKLGETFRVAEGAVAKRIFFNLSVRLFAVLCIRPNSTENQSNLFKDQEKWQVSWLAFPKSLNEQDPVKGYSIPLSKSGRNIPLEMVPDIYSAETRVMQLDSRWWHGIRLHPQNIARLPLGKISQSEKKEALVSLSQGKIYIGFLS